MIEKRNTFIFLFVWFLLSLTKITGLNADDIAEFKFFDIGGEDTIETAKRKINQAQFQCVKGKTTFLKLANIQKIIDAKVHPKTLNRLVLMDKTLESFGQNLPYEEMPIDVFSCSPKQESPFLFVQMLFSTYDKTILSLEIQTEQFQASAQKLSAKFGDCIFEGYCENKKNVLVLADKPGWNIKVTFQNNLTVIYESINRLQQERKNENENEIENAF